MPSFWPKYAFVGLTILKSFVTIVATPKQNCFCYSSEFKTSLDNLLNFLRLCCQNMIECCTKQTYVLKFGD